MSTHYFRTVEAYKFPRMWKRNFIERLNKILEEKVHEKEVGQTLLKKMRRKMGLQEAQVRDGRELVEVEVLEEEEESMQLPIIYAKLKVTKHRNAQRNKVPVKEVILECI